MKKLLLLGDSILKGVYLSDGGKYKLYPGRNLPALEERGVEVKNLSKMGACVDYCERTLEAKHDLIDRETDVILSFGGNDCTYKWDEVSADPKGEHFCATLPEKFLAAYTRSIERVKALAGRVFVMNLFPIKSSLYLDFLSKGLSKENILHWLGDEQTLCRWHEHYNRLAERAANAAGAQLIDIRDVFLSRRDCGSLVSADGIHPTEEGHRLIREAILGTI